MRDNFIGERVEVLRDERFGAYIMFEPAKIARITDLLRKNGISFLLEGGPNAHKGTPEASVMDFGKNPDIENIQRVLDSVQ
jgi:hypothetical protein